MTSATTSFYAALFALLYLVLSLRTLRLRCLAKIPVGDTYQHGGVIG